MTEKTTINNSEYIIRLLEKEQVGAFFMVPGKLINPLMSRFNKKTSHTYSIKPIVAAHEAGAAAMADGYARASNHIGVCMAIDGPGVVNAISMLTAAQADRSPVLLISGQIPMDFQATGAIQDTSESGISTVDMLKPVCKASITITSTSTLPRYFRMVLGNMLAPSQGTGYISIPKDILLANAAEQPQKLTKSYHNASIIDIQATNKWITTNLSKHDKITIIIGSGCRGENTYHRLKTFSEKYNIPVATTISSKGMFNEEHPNFLGIFGYSGHERAIDNLIKNKSEIIILLGFNATQWTTLAWHKGFIEHPNFIQVDSDPSSIGQVLQVREGIVAEPLAFLDHLDTVGATILNAGLINRKLWMDTNHASNLVDKLFLRSNDNNDTLNFKRKIHPAVIVQQAREIFPKNTIAVADAGVHRSYVTHYWTTYGYGQFFAATTFAPMGWAVPAGIGIKIARPTQKVIVFTGDGCMLMSGLEIQTAAKLNLDIIFVVFNNGCYGASHFNNIENEPYLTRIPDHNWATIAGGLGLKSFRVHSNESMKSAYHEALNTPGPILIDVLCDKEVRAPAAIYAATLKTHAFM
ncbi:MAG: thiamine pyrophosphate-binding protein [Legionella sp.]|nr:thiamine pyrophosphate-binding protein [Legionella sp.]